MLYFMILTILQSSWSSLQKVFCASSCRTLHWIVLPSSIDLHYPIQLTYAHTPSLSLLPCVNVLDSAHRNTPYKVLKVDAKKSVWQDVSVVCSPKAFLNWMFYVLYLLIFCVDVLYIRTVLVVMFNGQKGDERILASIP